MQEIEVDQDDTSDAMNATISSILGAGGRPVGSPRSTEHYRKHRAVTKDDTRGYDPGKCLEADTLSKQFAPAGSLRDLLWHFIAADIGPSRLLVLFCDPANGANPDADVVMTIDGITPQVKGDDRKGEKKDSGATNPGLPPVAVRAQMREDFDRLNAQGQALVLQRLRDVGHNPVQLGLEKARKVTAKVRKAA